MQNQIKNRKYFSTHKYQNSENFSIKHLQWSKAYYKKKQQQKKILRKDTLQISVVAVQRCIEKIYP